MSRRSGFKARPLFSAHKRKAVAPRRSLWRATGAFFYRNLKRLCMAIGFMFLLSIVLSALFASMLADDGTGATLPDKMVLYLPIEDEFSDYSVPSPYSFVARPNFRHIIDTIDYAQRDRRVKGLLITPKGGSLSLAQLQELRDAVKRFRASGKPTWFYAESMDEGLGSYYLASATNQIWMQPVGTLSIPGLRAEMPFARELMDKIGVEPQFFARKEYKDVFSAFTEKGMTDNSRESVTKMLNDVGGQMIGQIAADRKKTTDDIQQNINKGMLTDQEALAAGLVDHLEYFDQLRQNIRMEVVGTTDLKAMKFVGFEGYLDHVQSSLETLKPGTHAQIALIYAVGTIVSGDTASASVAMGGTMAHADDIAKVIDQSVRDKHIKAIVLRIDSPGGSPTASETIRRSLVRAQEKGKKVVVSMGGMAASGGYWIASPADRIFAMPATITGSIGVAGGKFVMAELWEKMGVNWDNVHIGDNSSMLSPNEPYSDAGRERMNTLMDSIYDAFITRVSEGRHMSKEKVDQVARGRVWTGASALPLGLVDEIGSLNDALDHAAIISGYKGRRDVAIVELPKQKSVIEKIAELLNTQARVGQGLSAQAAIGELLAPFVSQYNNAGYVARESITIQ